MRKFFLLLIIFTISISFLGGINASAEEDLISARGRVIDVETIDMDEELFIEGQLVTIEVLNGKYKGEVLLIPNYTTGNFVFDIPVVEGDKVIIFIEEFSDGSYEAYITDYARDRYVYWLLLIFILLLIIVGRKTGLKAVLTLGLTVLLVVKLLLPGILKGYNPILLTVLTSLLITLITIFVIAGINTKSISAIIGVLGGVITAGLIAYYIGSRVKLTGLSNEEAAMLMYIPQGITFDFRGLLFSGIILGALGAVMDVGISVASAMEEIKRVSPLIKTKELIISGMNVGKDIMGTMANTLILAYTGSAIPLLLLFMAYETNFTKILNLDIIATEIVRALSGTIGLILTIPITAFTAGILHDKFKKKPQNEE